MNRFVKTILCSVLLLGSVQQSCNAESIGLPLLAAGAVTGVATGIILAKTRKGQAISASARRGVTRFGKGLLQLPKNTYLRKGALGIALVYGTYLIIKNVKENKIAVQKATDQVTALKKALRTLQPAHQLLAECSVCLQYEEEEGIELFNPCSADHPPFICRNCIQSLITTSPHGYGVKIPCPLCRNDITRQAIRIGQSKLNPS